jgi:hypothetical protein
MFFETLKTAIGLSPRDESVEPIVRPASETPQLSTTIPDQVKPPVAPTRPVPETLEPSTVTSNGTAARLRVELEIAKSCVARLAESLSESEQQLATVQAAYDAAIRDYLLIGKNEPDRTELQAALSKVASLHRIVKETQDHVPALTAELALAEALENVTASQERFPVLVAHAQTRLEEFQRAVTAVRNAEEALFGALYRPDGLKGAWPSELEREAMKARCVISFQARETARLNRCSINPDFETDGNPNLWASEAEVRALQMQQADRVAAADANTAAYAQRVLAEARGGSNARF